MKKLTLTGYLAASALLCGVTAVTPLVAQDTTQQTQAASANNTAEPIGSANRAG